MDQEKATLGAGCFWCTEAVFQDLKGVSQVLPGYSGGTSAHPTYEAVCTGDTGHAEVAQITFDPAQLSFEQLLEVFWHIHNPTTLNRQGGDIGSQYRSIIFYHTETQQQLAEASKQKTDMSDLWQDPLITEITPFSEFYPAEAYHQNYYQNNSRQNYCSVVIAPKLQKFYKTFRHLLKSTS